MPTYETAEWTNLWFEHAPDAEAKRVLLIGDSIACGYRDAANRELDGAYRLDLIGGSKALDHPYYLEEIDAVWRQFGFRYEAIHFNNGLHGWHLDAAQYEALFERAVAHLLEAHPESKLAIALSTSLCVPGSERRFDDERNLVVKARNEAALRVAAKYGLPVDDLYASSVGHPEYRSEDGAHFSDAGKAVQGKLVADFLRELLHA